VYSLRLKLFVFVSIVYILNNAYIGAEHVFFLPLLQVHADSSHDFHIQSTEVNFTAGNKTKKNPNAVSSDSFFELNIGLAVLGLYDPEAAVVPGASFMYGGTFPNEGLVYELQIGAALPTLFTGKIGVGIGDLDRNIIFALRPWPFTIGPQVKIEHITFSLEIGTAEESSFRAVPYRNSWL
jgi:hypothetical protein